MILTYLQKIAKGQELRTKQFYEYTIISFSAGFINDNSFLISSECKFPTSNGRRNRVKPLMKEVTNVNLYQTYSAK